MREILFKAKRIDNGEWVEGFYYKMSETTYCFAEDYEWNPVPEHHYILQERMTDWGLPNQIIQIEVDSKTLCQFTGLCDENGNKIWENDIIQYGAAAAVVKFGEYGNRDLGFYIDFPEETNYRKDFSYWVDKVVVIGNAVDNRSLLQEVPE